MIPTQTRGIMTQFSSKNPDLSNEEWDELCSLKDAINLNPASVHYDKMERFADLMVRTLQGKGDPCF
jgi:hypothetical protein